MAIPPPPRPQQRSNMMDQLGLTNRVLERGSGQTSKSALPAPNFLPEIKKEGKKGGGVFDIPILGPIIDAIDTPRAAIVSGIKEFGDLFEDGQSFSIGEWYDQTRDNIMMGEVLRDWEVELPGPLHFAVGLGLDIAFDPLTYMAGAGLIARFSKWEDVANGLRKAETVARQAKNFKKADELGAAAAKVQRTKSVLSAGKYLDEIGISSGARFTIPGTGRLGRTIIEKPLRTIFPAVGKKLDDMRVNQLVSGGKAAPGNWFRWGDETNKALDLTKPNNLKLVRQRVAELRGQKGAVAPINRKRVATGTEADAAARLAMRMPVEMPGSAQLLAKIPGNTAFVAAVASGPGKVFSNAADTNLGYKIGQAFNTNVDINKMIRSKDINEQVNGVWIKRIAQTANTRSSTFANQARVGAENLKRAADEAGIDFDELMFAAENETSYLISQGSKFAGDESLGVLPAPLRDFLESVNASRAEAGLEEITPEQLLKWGEIDDVASLSPEARRAVGLTDENAFPFFRQWDEANPTNPEMKAWAEPGYQDIQLQNMDKSEVLDVAIPSKWEAQMRMKQWIRNNPDEWQKIRGSKNVDPQAAALRQQAREYLDNLRRLVNEALPFSDDLPEVIGELYLMRYISREGAEKLDELGRLKNVLLPKNPDQVIPGNSFIKRHWITPEGMKQIVRRNLQPGGDPDAPINIEKLIDDLGVDPSLTGKELERELITAIEEAADDGFRITGADGFVYTNKTHVGTFKDINKAGSIRDQLSRMGKEGYGDSWVDIFDTDMTKALTRYIDSHARYIRSQYVVDGLAQRGIIVRGANGQLTRAAAKRLTAQSTKAGKKLTKDTARRDELKVKEAMQAKWVSYYTEGMIENSPNFNKAVKAANEMAAIEAEMITVGSVMEAIANGSGIEGLSNDALALISPGSTYDLRRGVGYISQKVKQTADEAARLHAAREDAVEMIHAIDDQVKQVEEMLKRIQAVQGIDPELQGFIPLLDGYRELQELADSLREGLRNFKSTFVSRMADDITVRAADDLEDFMNAMSADELFDFARNGKMLASKARKDELGRISKRLGQIFKGNPKWEKWLEDMPELVELKRLIAGLDEGDMGILARLDRYRTIKGADALIDGKSPIGKNIADLLSDIGAAERKLLNAKLREIEEILTLGLGRQATKPANEALQETFDLLGAKFEQLEVAMGTAQKKLLATEADLSRLRKKWEGRLNATRAELERLGRTEAEILEALGRKQFGELNEDQLSRLMGVIGEQQRIVDELKLEKMRLMDSDRTTIRMSAADSQQAAVDELRKVRNLHNLSDAYGGRLNDYMVNMMGLGNVNNVSNRTNNLLRGYSLVGGAGEGTVELFSAAVQAAARTADVKAMSDFMQKYSKFLNWWKAGAVATPGFIARNMMGGMWINNQIAGVPMGMHGRVLGIRRAARQAAADAGRPEDIAYGLRLLIDEGAPIRLKGKLGGPQMQAAVPPDELETFLKWYETGMATSGQVSQEVQSSLDAIGGGQRTFNPLKAEFAPFAQVRAWNQDAEFMLRGAVAHHTAMGGGSIDDAFQLVNKYHFDYADLTQTERKMKQVIPFWTWQKNILPVLVESLGKKPTAWGRLQQIKREMELHSPEEGLVPSWFGENMGIRLPFNVGGSRAYALPDLPFRDLAKWAKVLDSKEPWRPIAESAFPLYKLPIELHFGKQYFADIPFTGRYQQVPPSYRAIPGLLPTLGALGLAKKNNKGEWKVTDKTLYSLDQFNPVLGRMRRLFPGEKTKQERITSTWVSTLFGTNIRQNTPSAKRSELIRMQKEFAEELRDKKDIEFREV